MIDTIVLTLKEKDFQITEPERFIPNANLVLNNRLQNLIAKQNPTKKELKNKIYKPYLSLSNRINTLHFYEPSLKIELSLPKLLFGNNFQELQYKDFSSVADKLVTSLSSMGVKVSLESVYNAQVATVHYSKNFVFTDGTIPYHYIKKIKQANLKNSLDVNQTDYRNEGHSFKWHCNSYEVVFYDKLKDLEKAKISEKRAIEKCNTIQLNTFDKIRNKINKLEVLRMEVRLNKRTKIKQLFQKLNIKSDLTFKKLFKPAISKKVLLHYLDELETQSIDLTSFKYNSDKELLSALIVNNPELKPKQIFQIFGLRKAFDFANTKELQNMFPNLNLKTWSRFIKEVNQVKYRNRTSSFTDLRDKLERFKPVRYSMLCSNRLNS